MDWCHLCFSHLCFIAHINPGNRFFISSPKPLFWQLAKCVLQKVSSSIFSSFLPLLFPIPSQTLLSKHDWTVAFVSWPCHDSLLILPEVQFLGYSCDFSYSIILAGEKMTCFCCTWVLRKSTHSLVTISKGFSTICISKWGTQTPGRNKLWTDYVLSLERKKNL